METLAVRKKGRNFREKYAFLASGQIIISCNIPNDGKNVKTDFLTTSLQKSKTYS